MQLIHIEYAGKEARVGFNALPDTSGKSKLTQRTSTGEISRFRVFNGTTPGLNAASLSANDLIEEDPELDLTRAGSRLEAETTAAYFDPTEADPRPIGDFEEIDLILDPSGAEKERRPHLNRKSNLDTIHPIKIAKRMPLAEALTSFVFRACHQLVHQDGLTMDFLYDLAKDLHDKQEMALLGAGAKGNQPLVLREKGSPYRAFLYGEVAQDSREYKLVVILSDQELKLPVDANG